MPIPLEMCSMQAMYLPVLSPNGEFNGFDIRYVCLPIVYEGPIIGDPIKFKRLRNVRLQ